MDIKLKSKSLQMGSLILCVYLFAFSWLSIVDISNHANYLDKNYYFHSQVFQDELINFSILANQYEFLYGENYKQETDQQKLGTDYAGVQQLQETDTQQKIDQIQASYNILQIADDIKAGHQDIAQSQIAERDNKIAQVKAESEQSLNERIKLLVKNRDQDYANLEQALLHNQIHYYFVRKGDKPRILTNLNTGSGSSVPSEMDVQNQIQSNALFSVQFPSHGTSTLPIVQNFYQQFQQDGWTCYIMIPNDPSTRMFADYTYFNSIRMRVMKEMGLGALSLLTAICLSLIIRKKKLQAALPYLDRCSDFMLKVPFDGRIAVLIVVLLLLFNFSGGSFFYKPSSLPDLLGQLATLTFYTLLIAYMAIAIKVDRSLVKDWERLTVQWKSSICYQLFHRADSGFEGKSILLKTFLLLGLTFGLGVMVILTLEDHSRRISFLTMFYLLGYLVVILPYLLQKMMLLNRILKGTQEIAAGNLTVTIQEKGKGNLAMLARHINQMRNGFKMSLDSQLRSERLKTELITNVSHDLKTPLTSIVSYVDLLKKGELTQEERDSYLDVIDRKTHRLKMLIDDLFEASKTASGNVDLQIEQVDVVALINQALAEFSSSNTTLTFKIKTEQQKIWVPLDGKKTWRVFENLISNAHKYSLPNTRVYITISENEDDVILTMQNISAYEIEFDSNELFERFKRGDQSRHTEGSGLGLAIAKNIVELQGGQLQLEVDGDQFKVIIQFKK